MNSQRITIIPCIHGKLTGDGTLSHPDIHWILKEWLERHPKLKERTQDIRVGRGTMTLSHGGRTELIRVTVIAGPDIAGYDPAHDSDLYEYYLLDDRGDRERSQNG